MTPLDCRFGPAWRRKESISRGFWSAGDWNPSLPLLPPNPVWEDERFSGKGRPVRLPDPEELDFDLIRRAKIFHTDGLFPEAALAAAKAAREAGVPVIVDAGSFREGMLELARLSDYFIVSSAFARSLAGREDPLAACREMAALGPGLVGVTLGKEGYMALDRGRLIRRPAYPVDAMDTTGCGDVFHAGFIYGLLQGWTTDRSLDWGAWAASRVSLKLGGRAGIPPLPGWVEKQGQKQIISE